MKKKTKILIVITTVLFIGLLTALILYNVIRPKDKKQELETEVEKITSKYEMKGNSLEDFDLAFLKLEQKSSNIIYSPLSIKYALDMLSEGTSNRSKAQIDSVIGNYEAKKYPNNSHMAFANALFIQNDYRYNIKETYKENLSKKYNAEIIYDSFTSGENINNWVNNKTLGLINNLIDDTTNLNYLLLNSLAIDMEWKNLIQQTIDGYPYYEVSYHHENFMHYINPLEADSYEELTFNDRINAKAVEIGAAINNYDIVKELGKENIFNLIKREYKEWLIYMELNETEEEIDKYVEKFINELDSNYHQVDTSTDFSYYIDNKVKVFSKELKEYDGITLEYIGIMPDNIKSFIENMDANSINKIIDNLKTINSENFEEGKVTQIVGYIPLFKFDYTLNLLKDLKKLGITDVFTKGKADLSNLTIDKESYINKVVHKANIEFSNEGIKAAATTGFGGYGDASDEFEYLFEIPVVKIDLTFDKPYIFLIRDKDSGEVWFMGQVYEPIESTNEY